VECSGGKLNSIQGRIKVLCGDERHRNPLSPSNKFARIVPKAGLSHNPHGGRIELDVWLNENNAPRWSLTQSAVHMPYYDQTLILIAADRAEDSKHFDEFVEPDPTPPQIPSFK